MRHILTSFFIGCAIIFFSCQENPYPQGKNLYTFYCANCHMDDGTGLKKLIPSINSIGHLSTIKNNLPCIIKYGIDGPINVQGVEFNQTMAGFRHLTDAEISNIINYMLATWAPKDPPILPQIVKDQLENCPQKGN